MYNVEKIRAWKADVQKQIDAVIANASGDLLEIVLSQIRAGDKLEINMGLASLEDADWLSYTWDYGTIEGPEKPEGVDEFIDELTNLSHSNYFNTSVSIGV